MLVTSNNALIDALKESEAALEQPEKWFFSCTILSNILSEQGQPQLSHLWKSLARETEINRATYHVLVGATYIQLEDWEQAIHHNKAAIAIDENLALAYSNLAKLYEKLGQTEEALEYRYKSMSMRPEQTSANDCEELGTILLDQGQAADAMDCYRRAIQNNPKQWSAYYRIAHILNWAKQPERAISYYELLLERDPNQIEAHQKLGKLLLEQKKYKEAIEHFKVATSQKPDFNWANFGLAKAHVALEQWDEAIQVCQNALQTNGEQQWPYRQLAKAWLAKQQLSKAQSCWQKIAALQGWTEWGDRGYDFTQDPFTHKMSLWNKQLQDEFHLSQRSNSLKVLQIGGNQGMWSCWMLDKVLTRSDDQFICIPPTPSKALQANLGKTASKCNITYLEGNPIEMLRQLNTESPSNQDLIHIQRCRSQVELAHELACLSWPLLRDGGMMVLGHYATASINSSPPSSMERFLEHIKGQFSISHQEQSLFICKQGTKL